VIADVGHGKPILEKSLQTKGYSIAVWPPVRGDAQGEYAGIDAVNATLIQINRDCPQTQIVVITYSQGSHATDGVRFLPVAIQNQIKAMVLLGDPLFNPALTTVNKGTFSAPWEGVWVTSWGVGALPARQLSAPLLGKTASYCLANDVVCNTSPASIAACTNMANCPHVKYKPEWTQQAATWVRSKVTP